MKYITNYLARNVNKDKRNRNTNHFQILYIFKY